MANAQISGLASGLDTASIISQLMKLEAVPQSRLKTQLAKEQSSVAALQAVNAKLAALMTQAGKLAETTGWSPVKVSASDTHVTVAGAEGATPGEVTLNVSALATSHQVRFGAAAAADVVAGSGLTIDFADPAVADLTVSLTDRTLDGVVSALNGSGTGVHASKVDVGGGQYRLLVSSSTSGAATRFSLTSDGSPLTIGAGEVVTAGADAAFTVGGIPVTSASNTVTAVSGLAITLGPGTPFGTDITVSSAMDTSGLKASVKSLVDGMNSALTGLDALTTYDGETKTRGALYGEPALRAARSSIAGSIYPGDGGSMAGVGIQVDRYGKLTFDEAAFDAAYAADPAAVRDAFTETATGGTASTGGAVDGFASRVESVMKSLSDSIDGSVSLAVKAHSTRIEDFSDRIDGWERTLGLRKATLERQYAALETALQRMQSQSSWLSGQLSALSASRG